MRVKNMSVSVDLRQWKVQAVSNRKSMLPGSSVQSPWLRRECSWADVAFFLCKLRQWRSMAKTRSKKLEWSSSICSSFTDGMSRASLPISFQDLPIALATAISCFSLTMPEPVRRDRGRKTKRLSYSGLSGMRFAALSLTTVADLFGWTGIWCLICLFSFVWGVISPLEIIRKNISI